MTISKLQFTPGIHREGTEYSEQGSWYNCDKIRFRVWATPRRSAGGCKATDEVFKGVSRALMNWTLLDGKDCLAMGTNKKFYIEYAGTINDITPIRYSDPVKNNAITTGIGRRLHAHVHDFCRARRCCRGLRDL
jgi:hypothetical protein